MCVIIFQLHLYEEYGAAPGYKCILMQLPQWLFFWIYSTVFKNMKIIAFFFLPVMAEIITLEAKLCLVSQFDKGSTTTINVPLLL